MLTVCDHHPQRLPIMQTSGFADPSRHGADPAPVHARFMPATDFARWRTMVASSPNGRAAHPHARPGSDIVVGARQSSPPQTRGGLPPGALRRVREYIETNMEQSIGLKALASAAGLSMYHFARAFKQSQGMTPHSYVVQQRLARARQLLTETDLPL